MWIITVLIHRFMHRVWHIFKTTSLPKTCNMRSIWTGAIGFGLVNIPVKLYSAVEAEQKINLQMVDKRDLGKIRFKRVNENTGEEVQLKDIVKGYKVED